MQWWKEFRTLELPVFIISTKNVIKQVNDKDATLYRIMSKLEDIVIEWAQTISEIDEKEFIDFFISEWLRIKISPPLEIIVFELSFKIIEGAIMALNNCSIEDYNTQCLLFLNDRVEYLKACKIRINSVLLISFIKN